MDERLTYIPNLTHFEVLIKKREWFCMFHCKVVRTFQDTKEQQKPCLEVLLAYQA